MARTKIKRRTYNNKKSAAVNSLKDSESLRAEETMQDAADSQLQEGGVAVQTENKDNKSDSLPDSPAQGDKQENVIPTSPVLGCRVSISQRQQSHLPVSDEMPNHSSGLQENCSNATNLQESFPDNESLQESLVKEAYIQESSLNEAFPQECSLDKEADTQDSTLDKEVGLQESGLDKEEGVQETCPDKESGLQEGHQNAEANLHESDSELPAIYLAQNSPVLGCRQVKVSDIYAQRNNSPCDSDHMADIRPTSPNSPLNLTWDSSMKENCQLQANFRPITPDMSQISVDEIFSPNTQKKLRTSIRALFPNGPPPPPPVRPVRRPKKGDVPYIVGCTTRKRVPSPKCLTVFQGDDYGITDATNCDEDDQCSPAKRARRAPNGTASLSKSRFNPQSDEIAARLKLYDKIDKLLGRAPKDETVGYMSKPSSSRSQAFSPLPSTSTDNETIMKNDKYFRESFNCDNDNFDLEDDEELPEIVWDKNKCKEEKSNSNDSFSSINEDRSKHSRSDTKCFPMVLSNEDMNNNNNNNNDDVIPMDYDFSEIEFDKYIPKEKLIDCTDVEVVDTKPKGELIDTIDLKDGYISMSSGVHCPRSSDVICIDEDLNSNNTITNGPFTSNNENGVMNHTSIEITGNLETSPVLRSCNRMSTITEATQSNLVIEVPDIESTVSTGTQASTSRIPMWNEDVQFVSETRTNEPRSSNNNENGPNVSDVQIVGSSISQSKNTGPTDNNLINQLEQFFSFLSESYGPNGPRKLRNQIRKKNKKQKPKQTNCSPTVVNNENTAPTVNQVSIPDSTALQPPAPSNQSPSNGKKLGDCPICLDSLSTGFIASTNCGHVFCLDCIKKSLSTSGKKCPTCRKQLKGAGYHQVFL